MSSTAPEVLVVEDDLPTRELYVFLLNKAGFSPRATHNGRQALEACRERRPDVVLTDLRLPGLDGFELAGELRLLFGNETPPIVAITGHVPADDDLRLVRAQFDRLLVKPVTPDLLVTAISETLSIRKDPYMANVNIPSNPTQQPGKQSGADPHQGNKREPGTPQQPNYGSTKDQEQPNGRASKGTANR